MPNMTTRFGSRTAMFRRMLFTQWLWARAGLIPLAVIAFAVPIVAVQPFNNPEAVGFQLQYMLRQSATWSPAYPIVATILGVLLGASAWSADHRTHHVYALSLPVPRWEFTMLRMVSGVILLAGVSVVFWIGTTVATASASLPLALQGYPNALAARFFLAAAVAFTTFFAIAAGTARTAGSLLGLVAFVALTQLFSQMFDLGLDVIGPLVDQLSSLSGPFGVFAGRWLLVDF